MDRLHRNLFGILKFTEWPTTLGIILRNMKRSVEDQLLAGNFYAIMDKIKADILQIAKKWH